MWTASGPGRGDGGTASQEHGGAGAQPGGQREATPVYIADSDAVSEMQGSSSGVRGSGRRGSCATCSCTRPPSGGSTTQCRTCSLPLANGGPGRLLRVPGAPGSGGLVACCPGQMFELPSLELRVYYWRSQFLYLTEGDRNAALPRSTGAASSSGRGEARAGVSAQHGTQRRFSGGSCHYLLGFSAQAPDCRSEDFRPSWRGVLLTQHVTTTGARQTALNRMNTRLLRQGASRLSSVCPALCSRLETLLERQLDADS